MKPVHTVWIVWAICLLLGGLIFTMYSYNSDQRREAFELRKSYVDKCNLTPKQAERLLPEIP